MNNPAHADIENLIRGIILPFYHVKRDIPLPIGERRSENDAEHSWSVAFLACALAPQIDPKLDVGKIAQYATVHDIVEVYAGDTSTFAPQEALDSKAEREEAALKRIKNEFSQFPWIAQTIEEYESRSTDEAKFVYALDKYIVLTYRYIDEGRSFRECQLTHEMFDRKLEVHRKKAQSHSEIAKYYEEVRALFDSHPEFFHVDG